MLVHVPAVQNAKEMKNKTFSMFLLRDTSGIILITPLILKYIKRKFFPFLLEKKLNNRSLITTEVIF